jgi:hypothetical protein
MDLIWNAYKLLSQLSSQFNLTLIHSTPLHTSAVVIGEPVDTHFFTPRSRAEAMRIKEQLLQLQQQSSSGSVEQRQQSQQSHQSRQKQSSTSASSGQLFSLLETIEHDTFVFLFVGKVIVSYYKT